MVSRKQRPIVLLLALLSFSLVASESTCNDAESESSPGLPSERDLMRVEFGANKFVAVGEYSAIWTSFDGRLFTIRQDEPDHTLYAVAFGAGVAGVWVAPGDRGIFYISEDGFGGFDWGLSTFGIKQPIRGATYGAGRFVFVGGHGRVITRDDSGAFHNGKSHTEQELHDVVFGDGLFVAVGDRGTIVTSTDGTHWNLKKSGITTNLRGIGWGDGQFVAVGEDGWILTSRDGEDWIRQTSPTNLELRDVAFGASSYVIVGDGGVVLSSVDAATWTIRPIQTNDPNGYFNGVAFGNGVFVAVGWAGTHMNSNDGVTWF